MDNKERKKQENSIDEINSVLVDTEKILLESINKLSFIKNRDFSDNREINARVEFVCRALFSASKYLKINKLNNSMLNK